MASDVIPSGWHTVIGYYLEYKSMESNNLLKEKRVRMAKLTTTFVLLMLGVVIVTESGVMADTLVADQPLKVKDKVPQKVCAFNLRDVRLL